MTNDALINNKKLSIPHSINVKFQVDLLDYYKPKVYLGLYILFNKQKIEGFLEVDSKNYHSDFLAKVEGMKIDFLIFKFNGFKALDDENFQKFVNKCLKLYSHFVIFYINGELNKKKLNDGLNLKLDDTFLEKRSFMIYSEIPAKKTNIFNI